MRNNTAGNEGKGANSGPLLQRVVLDAHRKGIKSAHYNEVADNEAEGNVSRCERVAYSVVK